MIIISVRGSVFVCVTNLDMDDNYILLVLESPLLKIRHILECGQGGTSVTKHFDNNRTKNLPHNRHPYRTRVCSGLLSLEIHFLEERRRRRSLFFSTKGLLVL
jgi:hypothetical protein